MKSKIKKEYFEIPPQLSKELGVSEDTIKNPPTWSSFTKEVEETVTACHVDAIEFLIYYKMNIDSLYEGEEHYKHSMILDNFINDFRKNCVCYHKPIFKKGKC